MNKPKYAALFILFLVLFGCENSDTKYGKGQSTDSCTKISTEKSDNVNNIKTIKFVYVVSRNVVDCKKSPNVNSNSITKLDYALRLEVVKDTNDWYGIKVLVNDHWALGYIKKENTGPISEISISPEDLYSVSLVTLNNDTSDVSKQINLSKYLEIKLIDKYEYDANKQKSKRFFLCDTGLFKKNKGILDLKTNNGIKRFTDITEGPDESSAEYNFVGQYSFLNQYVVSGSYYENQDFKFVDKTSGKVTYDYIDLPLVSSDKKYLCALHANDYESTADFELYKIKNEKYVKFLYSSFYSWIPHGDDSDVFWSLLGSLYVKIIHPIAIGSETKKFQYIKITPKDI